MDETHSQGSDQTLVPGTHGIREEEVAESAPMVRALVVSRLEMMWRAVEPHIMPPAELGEPARRPDPRFVEAGIRLTDRLIQLYGLLKPTQAADAVTDQVEGQLEAVQAHLEQLEARLRGSGPHQG